MNKSEQYETITELTLLSNRLRRRRDEWKHKVELIERQMKAIKAERDTANWMNAVYSECMDTLKKENDQLRDQWSAAVAELNALKANEPF